MLERASTDKPRRRRFIHRVCLKCVIALALATPMSQASAAHSPSSLNGHWVTPNGDFDSGKPEDRSVAAVAMTYSENNKAVGVALYVTPAMSKEKAEQYGEGMMRMFKKTKIPANYYIQVMGESDQSGIAFDFFVHGYFIGTYAGKDTAAGILLAIDLYNGEAYALEMLKEGSL